MDRDNKNTLRFSNETNSNDNILMERVALLEEQLNSLKDEIKNIKRTDTSTCSSPSPSPSPGNTEEQSSTQTQTQTQTLISEAPASEESGSSIEVYHSSEIPVNNISERRPRSFRWSSSIVTRRINADDDYKALSEDTFTMMIMSRPGDKQWWYSFSIFAIQIALLTMILQDQWTYQYNAPPFDVPYRVSLTVHCGQFLAILLSLATQTDLVIAIITFIMLWERRRMYWTRVTEVAADSHVSVWTLRVAMPLGCKFIEGVLVLLTTFVIVIQSDSMIELFKDFAAMQLISELDNMMFWLALHGYAGISLMEGAKRAQKVRIKDDVVKSKCGIPLRTMVLVVLFLFMITGWTYIVYGQISGTFFYMKYPHCDIPKSKIPSMGDGICNGGDQNSVGCYFDDGDCITFNIAYPGCKVTDTVSVGNGFCDLEYNVPECAFDGGDCCPVETSPHKGDGSCDGLIFNTEICDFDGGDCLEFNAEYPECRVVTQDDYTLNELYNEFKRFEDEYRTRNIPVLGDGICQNFGYYNVPECGYEGGDCKECMDEFSMLIITDEELEVTFGDGECNGKSPLNTEACGYDGGDCYECMVYEAPHQRFFNASRIGNGVCDGGVYMTEGCYFDNGDCDEFLDKYPNCDAEYPYRIGDENCDTEYDYDACGRDGGDCYAHKKAFNLLNCTVDDIHRVGDGICDGGDYMVEGCLYDGGDCDNCTGVHLEWIGDGACDGVEYMTEACGYDGGDCDNCNVKNIHKVGDGNCDMDDDAGYNTEECYYDGGDCLNIIGGGGGGDGGIFGGGGFSWIKKTGGD